MDVLLICMLVVSICWSCFCTALVCKNEGTIQYLMKVIKELEKENNKLNDHIRELLFPDFEPNNEIDWFNKEKD